MTATPLTADEILAAEAVADRRRRRRRRGLALTAGTVALGITGGVAYAFWTTTGAGTGTASTGDVVAVVVKQTSTVAGLAPGLPSQVLAGTFENPNEGPVYITKLDAVVESTNKAGCSAVDYTISGVAIGREIPKGSSAWTGGSVQFKNDTARNQDACKNAVLTITYTAS